MFKGGYSATSGLVTIEAQHACMMMRGVGKISGLTRTEFLWKADDVSEVEMSCLIAQLGRGIRLN